MKRFTDTEKWKNPWFRKVPTKYKLIFLYMLDACDNAGVMHIDFELIGFTLKEEFDLKEFKEVFNGKIEFIAEDKILIKNFIFHQQGNLKENTTMSKNIAKLLERHKIRQHPEFKDIL